MAKGPPPDSVYPALGTLGEAYKQSRDPGPWVFKGQSVIITVEKTAHLRYRGANLLAKEQVIDGLLDQIEALENGVISTDPASPLPTKTK